LEETAPTSDAPPRGRTSISAQRLAAQLLDPDDQLFLDAMSAAGLLEELDEEELLRLASEVGEGEPDERCVTLLELYYDAGGDEEAAERRRRKDRFFLQRVDQPATASGLVARLVELTPELAEVTLERIGGGDGPLVLRSGEHFAAVLDDYDEETDTGELDIREAELRKSGVPMVTVRGLVHALNVLLDRRGVRERLVALRGDAEREIYAGLGVTEAMQLTRSGYLEDDDAEDVMDLGAW
jgi:hypothetical protein